MNETGLPGKGVFTCYAFTGSFKAGRDVRFCRFLKGGGFASLYTLTLSKTVTHPGFCSRTNHTRCSCGYGRKRAVGRTPGSSRGREATSSERSTGASSTSRSAAYPMWSSPPPRRRSWDSPCASSPADGAHSGRKASSGAENARARPRAWRRRRPASRFASGRRWLGVLRPLRRPLLWCGHKRPRRRSSPLAPGSTSRASHLFVA